MPIERLLTYLGHEINSPPLAAQGTQAQGEQTPKHAAQADQDGSKKMAAANARLLEEKTARIRQKLDMVINFDAADGATLETLLKGIKKLTTDATFPGIPIYVDPFGLSEANKTMSTKVGQDFKQQTIRSVLYFALRPLGLSYDVRDGFLMISSRTTILENRVEDIDRKLDRVLEMLGRLEPAK